MPRIRKTLSLPLKWHGGKHYLASHIIGLFPPHVHYVEPYFGGGAVLFAKPAEWIEGYSEVVNDIDGELMNFWRCIRSKGYALMADWLDGTPLSQEEFTLACKPSRRRIGDEDQYRAYCFFIRYRQSRQGLGKDFATLSRNRTRRGMNEQVSSWLSAIEGLPEAHERLKRVVIFCNGALKVIKQQDGPNTLFYLDPPYLHETRTAKDDYEHEMTRAQHEELLYALAGIKGKFLLSGYPSLLYRAAEKRHGWNCRQFVIDCKASGAKNKPKRVECVWSNFGVPTALARLAGRVAKKLRIGRELT